MAVCALCDSSFDEGCYVYELSEVDKEGDSIFVREIFITEEETDEINLELSDTVCIDCIDVQGFYLKTGQPHQQGVINRDSSEAERSELCAICGSDSPLVKISRGISLKIESEKICSACVEFKKLTLEAFFRMLLIPKREQLSAETLDMIHAILGTDDCVGMWYERLECNLCTLEGKNITTGVHKMEVHVRELHHDLGTGGSCRRDCNLHFRTDEERTSHERYCGAWCGECGKCYLKVRGNLPIPPHCLQTRFLVPPLEG
ncbi:Hypothetical predicted protein [Cloeon dipterum]|uniref:Uncharacterized protein n=1 Tax=Cloeon dipterum TaxID=197152 RepID=A0A8S1DT92_9INSE|nr:Hypothetical predicted protein [Cloeon dipterum]